MAETNPTSSILRGLVRLTIGCVYCSGVISIIGLVFLAIFFTGGPGYFGPLNDLAVAIQYVLMLPIAMTVWLALRPYGERLNLIALLIGLAGMISVSTLQILLITGVLPFRLQIGMVIPAFLVTLGWFVLTGHLGRSSGILPRSRLLHILAGLYIGYPVWAFMLGHRLLRSSQIED